MLSVGYDCFRFGYNCVIVYKYIIMSMNFIEQLERISAKIFQESIKNYKFKDIIAHKKAKPHSLT